MRQAVNIATPTPPTPPPQGRSFGDQIKEQVQQAVGAALAETRSELQRELFNLEARRNGLQAALDASPNGPGRSSIQLKLDEVNQEISHTQLALEKIEQQVVTRKVPTKVVQRNFPSTAPPSDFPGNFNPRNNFDPTPLVFGVMGILFVAFPLTLALVRFLWKRASNAPAPAITAEQARRFDRIEQSVDAIAIEVERISENQRYLTKLLGENRQPAKVEAGSRG